MILLLLNVKRKCVYACVCARAEVVGVGRTCVLRNGTLAYLLIYSSDTCLHNAHHSLSLTLSLSLQESST